MRDRVLTLGSGVLLGGALALGAASGQEAASRTQDATTATNTTPSLPAGTYVITPDTIDCTEFISPHQCRTTIVIRPSSSAKRTDVRFKAILVTGDGDDAAATVSTECEKGCANDLVQFSGEPAKAVRVTLALPDKWRDLVPPQVGSGFLGIITDGDKFDGAPKRLRVLASSPSYWQSLLILVPGALALFLTAGVAVKLHEENLLLNRRMGAPKWGTAQSWSSNLTVGAGLVNGVLTLTVVSDFTVFMTKSSYGVLSMLLGALMLLAPIVYGLSARRVSVRQKPAPNPLVPQPSTIDEVEGPVWSFLTAGALTIWASGGQLLLFALLIVELWRFAALSGLVATIVAGLSVMVWISLLIHGAKSMYGAAARAPIVEATATPERTQTGERTQGIVERAPEWALL
jgi:hypothetical protein